MIKLAKIVQCKSIKGVHLLKPRNSGQFEEKWVCSFMSSLGLSFVPVSETNEQTVSAVIPVQVVKDPGFAVKLQRMSDKGTPVVIVDGLANRLNAHSNPLNSRNLTIQSVIIRFFLNVMV